VSFLNNIFGDDSPNQWELLPTKLNQFDLLDFPDL